MRAYEIECRLRSLGSNTSPCARVVENVSSSLRASLHRGAFVSGLEAIDKRAAAPRLCARRGLAGPRVCTLLDRSKGKTAPVSVGRIGSGFVTGLPPLLPVQIGVAIAGPAGSQLSWALLACWCRPQYTGYQP